MKTAEQITAERVEISKEKVKLLREVLADVQYQMDFMAAIPHELNMVKASIEGRIIGLKNFIREHDES